jgi:hypothetical protein
MIDKERPPNVAAESTTSSAPRLGTAGDGMLVVRRKTAVLQAALHNKRYRA